MAAQIVIDDGTNPPVIGTSDNDSTFVAAVHTLSNWDNAGVLGWRWTLLDRPLRSSASLSATTTSTTTITPDIEGRYLIQLETFTDATRANLEGVDTQIVGITLPAPFDWGVPAAGETTQAGATGWAKGREQAIRDVHAFMNGGLPQLSGVIDETVVGPTEVVFGGFVLAGGDFPAGALKLRLLGTLTSGAGAMQGVLRLYDLGAVGGAPAAGVLRAEAVIPNAARGNPVVAETALTVSSVPGIGANEIYDTRRKYELRALVANATTESLKILNGSITLEN